MPVIVINGIRADVPGTDLAEAEDRIRQAVSGIQELELSPADVSVIFQSGPDYRAGCEIVVFIEGLFMKRPRTKDVRRRLADTVHDYLRSVFPEADLIECFVKPFDQRWGFAASRH